jgi:methylamine dehydrogenase heavy chain
MARPVWSSICLALGAATLASQGRAQPLPEETVPAVAELPSRYPDSWMFVHDFRFSSILDGRVAVVDLAAPTRNLKGLIRDAQLGGFLQARTRPELYTAETFYSRLTRGERTDAITIVDSSSLKPLGEIVLPGGKRSQTVTQPAAFQFTDGDRMALVFNFTPAASVTVVDLMARRVLNEIEIPGCSLIYPAGQRGFFTLCSNGGGLSFVLDAAGQVQRSVMLAPFNDIDGDPMFMMSATAGGVAYFPTFAGRVRPVDLSGDVARVLPAWPLVGEEDARGGWRPSGWQVIAADRAGRLYVLMQPNGKSGSHKDGGTEVWVFDPASKKRLGRIALAGPAVSIQVTRSDRPLLATASADGSLSVYDALSGERKRTLEGVAESPIVMYAVE